MKKEKHGWDKDMGVYYCSDGVHLSWWQAIGSTPEWVAWEKEVSRRMQRKKIKGVWDVDEARECGWMSVVHAKDFLRFVRKLK